MKQNEMRFLVNVIKSHVGFGKVGYDIASLTIKMERSQHFLY